MSNAGDLLRMLMPAVSPVPTTGARPGKQPIESLSFESLLEDAKQPAGQTETRPVNSTTEIDPQAPTDSTKPVDQTTQANALSQLTGIESIQNASLRRIVADAAGK